MPKYLNLISCGKERENEGEIGQSDCNSILVKQFKYAVECGADDYF